MTSRLMTVAVWVLVAACAAKTGDSPASDDQVPDDVSKAAAPGEAKAGDAKGATAEAAAAKATPIDIDDGNTVVEAKARDDTATLNLKAPEGWRVVTPPTEPDPTGGKFRLRDALAGLPPRSAGTLVATFETGKGKIHCDLFERKASVPVTQFVGLARGLRPVWNGGKKVWEKRKYYDGTTFHRVIAGFMAQGGDPAGNGSGLLGFTFDTGASRSRIKHDKPGQLCMASKRDVTNHAQFFITEVPASKLDGTFAVFGQCAPLPVVYQIARVMNSGTPHFRPLQAVGLERVEIARFEGGAAALAAGASDPGKLPVNELPGVVPPGRAVVEPKAQ